MMSVGISKTAKGTIDDITLSPEQLAAFERIENTDDNVFLTGKAGTGKSVLLRYFVSNTKKKVAVLAPTGIAALNVSGQTIHSFFGLKKGIQRTDLVDDVYSFNSESKKLYQELDTIVIDEISMVRCDMMEMINAKLQAARNEFFLPFGGCQMVVFGDLYQLPPVMEKSLDAKAYLNKHYTSGYFFAAPIVEAYPFVTIELQQVHRQIDQQFIALLNCARTGTITSNELHRINSRCITVPDGIDYVTLTGSNDRANEINMRHLRELPGEEFVYEAITDHYVDPNDTIVEMTLRLKVGAKVIMIKNDPKGRWVNGTLGEIARLSGCSIVVKIKGTEHVVDRQEWETIRYLYKEGLNRLERETIGKLIQFPLKLAYAMTIHKSQGQTYDGAVIDLSSGAFACGQTYVALSRCKTLDNIYLKTPLRFSDIQADKTVTTYMRD